MFTGGASFPSFAAAEARLVRKGFGVPRPANACVCVDARRIKAKIADTAVRLMMKERFF